MAHHLKEVFEEISRLIRSSVVQDFKQKIREVIEGLSTEEEAKLIGMLNGLKAEHEENYARKVKTIALDVQTQRALIGESLSHAMGDFDEDSISSDFNWLQRVKERIDYSIKLIEEAIAKGQ